MVRNGYGAKYIWYEMVSGYGTKWLWCKIHMVRNCNFVVRNGNLWYEMVMVQNSYGTKWFLAMVQIAILWYEMVNYGTKWLWYEMICFASGPGYNFYQNLKCSHND